MSVVDVSAVVLSFWTHSLGFQDCNYHVRIEVCEINLLGSFRALTSRPKISKFSKRVQMVRQCSGKSSRKSEIVEFPKSEPFNREFRDESQMERKFPGKLFSEIWVYLTRLSSFSEFMQIPNFLLSAMNSLFTMRHPRRRRRLCYNSLLLDSWQAFLLGKFYVNNWKSSGNDKWKCPCLQNCGNALSPGQTITIFQRNTSQHCWV